MFVCVLCCCFILAFQWRCGSYLRMISENGSGKEVSGDFRCNARLWLQVVRMQSDRFKARWIFPKIGVPPNHPILIEFSIINHPFWGTPIFGHTQVVSNICGDQPEKFGKVPSLTGVFSRFNTTTCAGSLNSHCFPMVGDGHQPYSRVLYTHYKVPYFPGGMTIPNVRS